MFVGGGISRSGSTIPVLFGTDPIDIGRIGLPEEVLALMTPGGTGGEPSLARKAKQLMRKERLFPPGSRALVMVSGGQDSLALLHVLVQGRLGEVGPDHIHALHINHHLRGKESDDDETLVVRACGDLGVGLSIVHRPIAKAQGNVQEEARNARRRAALETAAQLDCDRIALGHTADDQVETMLYRLGRYGGIAAFAGMRACEPPWVRPLLECRRQETAEYCQEHRLEFARDRGNAYPGYARTSIRERVLPAWEAALPGAVEAACRAADVAAEMREIAAAAAAAALPGVEYPGPCDQADCLSASAVLALDVPLRRLLLHAWLEGRARPAASRAAVLAVEALLDLPGSAERALAGGIRAVKEYDRLFLAPQVGGRGEARARSRRPDAVALPVPGSAGWLGGSVSAEPAERFRMPDLSREAFVDAAALADPVMIRGPRPGDRVRPFGSPGRRKLQDVLVDLQVPAGERPDWPLVVSGERIIWVCGLVVAEEGRIGPETKEIVRLTWERM